MTTRTPARRAIAVIGSGISGLMAAHVLARTDSVTLFEADGRLGGHAHTHDVALPDGSTMQVDTGFIVHNERTYPTLLRLFDELGVTTQDSDMSMSIRAPGAGIEYAGGKGLRGLLPTAATVFNPRYGRVLFQVPRFHRAARALLAADDRAPLITLRQFVADNRFGTDFCDYFLTPLVAAVWSCDPGAALDYPARYLFTFLDHHGMLSVTGSPTWRTVTGGSARYVEKVAERLHDVRTGTPVTAVHRHRDGVHVTAGAATAAFDAAVIATHPHQALAMLTEPTPLERQLLGAITYSANHAQLHTDESVLPRSANARASWNYLVPGGDRAADGVVVTYDLTRLMRLPTTGPRMLVTLNGAHLVHPARVISEMSYEHPLYTAAAVAAAARLGEVDSDVVAFAGAYRGWGFHEDGALSGLRAAQRLGGRWPAMMAAVPAGVGGAR